MRVSWVSQLLIVPYLFLVLENVPLLENGADTFGNFEITSRLKKGKVLLSPLHISRPLQFRVAEKPRRRRVRLDAKRTVRGIRDLPNKAIRRKRYSESLPCQLGKVWIQHQEPGELFLLIRSSFAVTVLLL